MQYYLLVPALLILLLAVRRRASSLVHSIPLWLPLLGLAWRIVIFTSSPKNIYLNGYVPLVANLDLFVTGLSINLLPKSAFLGTKSHQFAVLLALLGGYYLLIARLSFWSVQHGRLAEFWIYGPAISIFFSTAFIYIAEAGGRIGLERNRRALILIAIQEMGTLTYCIYVFHPQTYESLRRLLPASITLGQSVLLFPLVVAAVFGIAWLFNRFVEEPFEQRKRVSS